jgi:hypothetical protein
MLKKGGDLLDHVRPLLIKFIYIAAITMIFFSHLLLPAVPMGSSLVIALVTTAVLYFAGDLYLLPRLGVLLTAIANFIIAIVILALGSSFVRQPIGAGAVLATAAVIGVAEWIFYRYIRDEIGTSAEGKEMLSSPEFLGGEGTPPEEGEGEQSPEE